MIRYTLKCENDHSFDSWFQSADAFDKLQAAGMNACPDCGSVKVAKSLMAPQVTTARKKAAAPVEPASVPAETAPAPEAPLSTPQSEAEAAITRMKAEVEKNSEYVGMSFAEEARAMHDGEIDNRPIWGEAKPEEAKSLIEDGVPVLPLPFTPTRKTN
ncbi:DUF1178 family protein [Halocynthiibacter styelae]|uniref:DUF1178 family protein n=1 Tax=Halocynthiibacter styelae TaxID=2761955 RepID=A0A8J7IUE9_9RHOB|nr:DUF1178 family protein [Paenihalocynthiibacter styelae]MBI1492573.1 DUF1178 family protein [Paenihalocynthiibacter styelae]